MGKMRVYTIGTSTRQFEEFLDILKHYKIQLVVDVRRWPSSKRYPWFNKGNLSESLREGGIDYLHYPELGGYRKEGYADFAKSNEFREALERLVETINEKTAAVMCAELLWFRCHRRYIAESLVTYGHNLIHIFDKKRKQEHKSRDKDVNEKMNLVIWCDKKAEKLKKKSKG